MENMVNAAVQYRRALKRKLRCSKKVKDRLLEGFDTTLDTCLEEHANPSMDVLIFAFGPPEEMAKTLMAEVTPQELAQYRRYSLFTQLLASILTVILVLSTVYIWFYKTNGLTAVNNGSIIDRTTEPTSSIEQGENTP